MTALRFETTRLIMRPFEDRDAESFSQYRSDPEVARYQGWQAPYSLEQATQFITEMKSTEPGTSDQWYQLALELKQTGELIGDCAFYLLARDSRQAEIGFTLARAFQGQGYATEAVARLMDYLFNERQLHRVQANCDPENITSARLMERLGMRHEGRFIENVWLKGAWCTEDWYAILRREWMQR